MSESLESSQTPAYDVIPKCVVVTLLILRPLGETKDREAAKTEESRLPNGAARQ